MCVTQIDLKSYQCGGVEMGDNFSFNMHFIACFGLMASLCLQSPDHIGKEITCM